MSNEHHTDGIHDEEEIRHRDVAYDRTDLGSHNIFLFLIGFAIFGALILFVSWGVFRYFGNFRLTPRAAGPANIARPAVLPSGDPALRFPTPALQVNEPADLNKFNAANQELLNEYGWVDQQTGVVRIPIARAIDLVAQRGLPVRADAGVPVSQSYGSAPLLGGGVIPMPGNSAARMETSTPGKTLPSAGGARQAQSQPSGSRDQQSRSPQERQ
jgi:hypothetical protein